MRFLENLLKWAQQQPTAIRVVKIESPRQHGQVCSLVLDSIFNVFNFTLNHASHHLVPSYVSVELVCGCIDLFDETIDVFEEILQFRKLSYLLNDLDAVNTEKFHGFYLTINKWTHRTDVSYTFSLLHPVSMTTISESFLTFTTYTNCREMVYKSPDLVDKFENIIF